MEEKEFKCSIKYTLSKIGGKWKVVVIWHLYEDKVLRYGQLKKILHPITHKMLSTQLKELEAEGFITRKQYQCIPPKVEYSLSEKGKTLMPILHSMHKWGLENW